MTIFSFFNRAEREALSGGHFWYHLSGARHGQCQQTSAINDTNLHNTQTIFTPLSVFPLKSRKLIIFILILCLSQSFSSRQTSIFPLFYFNCVHYCPSFNSSFHALLQKAFSFAINFNVYWHFSLLLGLLFVCNFRCCWLFSFQLWRRRIMGCYMSFYFKLLDNTASNYLPISNVT